LESVFFISLSYQNIKAKSVAENLSNTSNEVRLNLYKYINPLLDCDEKIESQYINLKKLKAKLTKTIEEDILAGKIEKASLYLRDLNNGPWLGINEKEAYIPASLLKVPMLMMILKLSEFEPGLLDKKIKYEGKAEEKNNTTEKWQSLTIGEEYTIREMLDKMIIYSDNRSWNTLQNYLIENQGSDIITSLMAELGIIMPTHESDGFAITAKGYAGLFRVLYNSTFLNRQNSEYALKILIKADFNEGITKDLPTGLEAAHKFGFNNTTKSGHKFFHDCGIIYYPDKPYLLCLLTLSKDSVLTPSKTMSGLSNLIYNYWQFE
jgi:beta-lactamase class A